MLIIQRKDCSVGDGEGYQIFINKMEMGSISNNETAKFQLKNGDYEMYLKGKEFCSKSVRFSMNDGQIVEFHCEPDYSNTFFSKLICRLFRGGKGIRLELKQDIYL